MQKLVNYEGITSSYWKDVDSSEVSKGVFEYILWHGKNAKQAAIYEFEKNSKFHMIDSHEYGEEHIFVLSGVFSDGKGDYKAGSYIINPKGTAHVPQSKEGCVVLVTFPHGRES